MRLAAFLFLPAMLLFSAAAPAAEFNIGAPVVKNGLEIVPNYLLGITMEPMPPGMAMDGADVIQLEADVHATKDNAHGYKEKEWVPYLTIAYTVESKDGKFKKSGELAPMIAADGVHYANNISMGPPGAYHLTYRFDPPSKRGFARHTDKATGVPPWWEPFDASWDFQYPAKSK